jgi:four helix bundle protein
MIEKEKIERFEDMQVWQDAQNLAVSVYSLTKSFPAEEQYALSNQMRRCSSSISANIAEGFGRKSSKDKSQFYRIAYGSLLETKNFIYLAQRLNYIPEATTANLVNEIESLQRQINAILGYFKNNA